MPLEVRRGHELEVKGNCEPPYMMSGTELKSSGRTASTLLAEPSFQSLVWVFCCCLFVCFEIGSHVVQPGIQLTL